MVIVENILWTSSSVKARYPQEGQLRAMPNKITEIVPVRISNVRPIQKRDISLSKFPQVYISIELPRLFLHTHL